MSEIKEINSRAFDIVATLRETDHGLASAAADEIERLRAEVKLYDHTTKRQLQIMEALAPEIDTLRANLTEALRLMEPVAEAVASTRWPYVVNIARTDARAIADFVKRMRGAPNE